MNNIRAARIKAGYSQKQVALELGVSPPTVSAWESGAKNPITRNLQKMADMFGVSTDYLLGRTEQRPAEGNLLRELLFRRKLSQKQVAADLGMSPQRFNFYVTGRREPDHTTLLQLADYFNVSVDYLLGCQTPDPESAKKDPIPEDEIEANASRLPEEVRQLIQICKDRPELTSALLALARQIKNASSPQE